MALARLVVIEGPDLGQSFELPMRGGAIGRGEGSIVLLSDQTVSRQHCLLELRDGEMCVVDDGSRNRTLVNGAPVTVHALRDGDEVVVGKTRLAYLPSEGGVAVLRQVTPGRVTMEIGSRELLSLAAVAAVEIEARPETRARRYLAAIAGLGDRLRAEPGAGRDGVARAACDACVQALSADRAFVVMRDAGGRMAPIAAAVAPGDPAGAQLALPRDLVDKVGEGKAVTADAGTPGAPRAAIAVPLGGAGEEIIGLVWVERRGDRRWDTLEVMAVGCVAGLVAAAVVGADARDVLARGKAVLEERLGDGELVGDSPPMRQLREFVAKVAPADATVLLGGESGAGKEMVARALHRSSRRSRGPCVAVNCAALTESLIESELFGHEKGAFTGATERKLGRFEMADKGTLFLDEVGELPLSCQTKFLRVLEEQRFERVGGARPITVDVRVVAATNRDLVDMVRRGGFREDLYYRLSVIHAVVPPLRDRVDDIQILAEHFLTRARGQVARRISGFAADALAALRAHRWPGNVRELRNAVERAVVLGDGEWIRADDLPPGLGRTAPRRAAAPTPPLGSMAILEPATPMVPIAPVVPVAPVPEVAPPAAVATPAATGAAPARSLRELERDGIVAALAATNGNKAQAAAILEIDRSTLYKKLKDYNLT